MAQDLGESTGDSLARGDAPTWDSDSPEGGRGVHARKVWSFYMGGYGSGRRYDKKATVEEARTLDLAVLSRAGTLREIGTRSGGLTWRNAATEQETGSVGYVLTVGDHDGELRLLYNVRGTTPIDERIALDARPQPFGGVRWWFRCPLCSRRVAKLHLPPHGTIFVCRTCGELTYESVQSHDARLDALRRDPVALLHALQKGTSSMLAVRAALKGL